jgi:hypothetical protein
MGTIFVYGLLHCLEVRVVRANISNLGIVYEGDGGGVNVLALNQYV